MDAFVDSLTDAQLVQLGAAIDLAILKRKQQQQRQPSPPATEGCRILIPNIDTSEGYAVVHDHLVEDMQNVRSRKIYIDEEKRTAKITFKNPILAKNAKIFLDDLYDEVKIY